MNNLIETAKKIQQKEAQWKRRGAKGVTYDMYQRDLELCGYACKICGTEYNATDSMSKLVMDHNHKTGTYRGVICARCNTGIVADLDRLSPEQIQRAIDYVNGTLK